MENNTNKEFTAEGFEIVYISAQFFDVLDKYMMSTARIPGNNILHEARNIALRDVPANIEFRKLEEKEIYA